VFDPRGGQWMDGRYVPSLLAAIGEVIERHMIDIGFLPSPKERREGRLEARQVANLPGSGPALLGGPPPGLGQCPKCGSLALIHQEGCDLCTSCGYSRCG
jgi:ribonucleoside-diphosphate reductase alpha chain